uniref:polyadenylate-binding protein 7-like n=1 Tax=Fragaria vesca subsp. vesca TaxID=101020 RepID=UPI0005CAE5AA|nr:PREDICTED: polyadenylate-binding protein 7-like [Fragaria vesca subsp. vesca]
MSLNLRDNLKSTQKKYGTGENLSDGIDNVALQDMFRKFGNVLSCKVAMFEDGKSKGYGFVQFETEESALAATDKLNGFTVANKQFIYGDVQVCDDVQEKHRVIGSGAMDEYKNDNDLLCGTSEL